MPLRWLLLSLLATTLLLGCASQKQLTRHERLVDSLRAENARLRARQRALADSLQTYDDVSTGRYYRQLRVLRSRIDRLTYELEMLRDGGITVATLSADELFKSATATLRPQAAERLAEVAARLQDVYPGRQVRIEGHADNVPLSSELKKKYPSNWELSAARAAAVARYFTSTHEMQPDRFVVIGYGATQPIASNETARGRRKNRRVRIAVLPQPRNFSRPLELSW